MTVKKVIIIGSGVAGLCAGIYGRMNEFETEIYEMHTGPGGECTGWKRKDYYFDGCIHWLMGSKPGTPLNKIWREVGALDDSIQIIKRDIFYCYEEDGRRLALYKDLAKLEAHFKEVAPEDSERITEFCRSIKALQPLSIPTDKPLDKMNILDITKMIVKMAPMMKYVSKYEKITISEFAAEFKSPLLRKFLTLLVPPYYNATALVTTLASLSGGDSGWPAGGSLALSKRMAQRYLDLGGKIYYKSKVDRILVENGKAIGIQLNDGRKCLGDYVISTADGHTTLFNLLEGKYLDDNLKILYSDQESYPIHTTIQVSLGVNCDLSHYPQVLYFRPERAVDGGGKQNDVIGIKHYCYDPTLAPKGKSVATVILDADFEWWEKNYREKESYQREKERIAVEICGLVEERYPETKGKIEVVDVATPMTYVRYCNAWQGAWMAWATTPKGRIRYIPGNLPGLENFYLSGQWTMPPGGLPSALVTGRWVMQRICGLEKRRFKTVS